MKKLITLLLVLTLALAQNACRKEATYEQTEQISSDPAVSEAKKWFDANVLLVNPKNTRQDESQPPRTKKPDWSKGISYVLNNETVTEVPLQYEGTSGSRLRRSYEPKPSAAYKEKEYENITTLNFLIIFKSADGKYRSTVLK